MKTADLKNKIEKLSVEFNTKNIKIIEGRIKVFTVIDGSDACILCDFVGENYDSEKNQFYKKNNRGVYKHLFSI